jgi:hypothetical protein
LFAFTDRYGHAYSSPHNASLLLLNPVSGERENTGTS